MSRHRLALCLLGREARQFHRHHIMDDAQFDGLRVGGRPIFAQHPVPLMSPLMGVSYTGHYSGKLLWVHHTHDSSALAVPGDHLPGRGARRAGRCRAESRFRLQWTQNAEHIMPARLPPSPLRASNTELVDYTPIIEQGRRRESSSADGMMRVGASWVDPAPRQSPR